MKPSFLPVEVDEINQRSIRGRPSNLWRSTLGQANEKEDEIDFHAANNCVSPSILMDR